MSEKPIFMGAAPFDSGVEIPHGWAEVQRIDQDNLFGDDFEACIALVKRWQALSGTFMDAFQQGAPLPPIAAYAPVVGVMLFDVDNDNGTNHFGETFDLIDALPRVRDFAPSWVYCVQKYVADAFEYESALDNEIEQDLEGA